MRTQGRLAAVRHSTSTCRAAAGWQFHPYQMHKSSNILGLSGCKYRYRSENIEDKSQAHNRSQTAQDHWTYLEMGCGAGYHRFHRLTEIIN